MNKVIRFSCIGFGLMRALMERLKFPVIDKKIFERSGTYEHFTPRNTGCEVNVVRPLIFVFDEFYGSLGPGG